MRFFIFLILLCKDIFKKKIDGSDEKFEFFSFILRSLSLYLRIFRNADISLNFLVKIFCPNIRSSRIHEKEKQERNSGRNFYGNGTREREGFYVRTNARIKKI